MVMKNQLLWNIELTETVFFVARVIFEKRMQKSLLKVYYFTSSVLALSFANDYIVQKDLKIISASFQNMFVVVFTWKRVQLLHLSFFLYRNEWMHISYLDCNLSYQFTVLGNGSVASRARSKFTRSIVNELEFELSRMLVKPNQVYSRV